MKICEKAEGDLYKKWYKEIRSVNLIMFNSGKIGNVCASEEAKLVIRAAFVCSKFIRGLVFSFWLHAVHIYVRWEWKIAYKIDSIVASFT